MNKIRKFILLKDLATSKARYKRRTVKAYAANACKG